MMIWLQIEPGPGVGIDRTATEAIRLAKMLGVGVTFQVCGVWCYANGKDTPEAIVATYQRTFLSKREG